MKKIVISALAASFLAGCATPPAKMSSGPTNFQITSTKSDRRVLTERTDVTIRAFAMSQGKRQEVSGARCQLTSDDGQAIVTTPQVVKMPMYDQRKELSNRGVPPSVAVQCTSGTMNGAALLAAKPGEIISGSGNLLVDVILIAGSAAAASSANWRYEPAVAVTLK